MHLRPATLALLLLAAATVGAEEQGGAPLEASKQALKALQADQTAKTGAATTGKLSDGLPQLQTPVPGATPLDFAPLQQSRADKELKKRKDGQKNWLLDGVDKLSREPKAKGRLAGNDKNAITIDDEENPDSSDPDYLLKLYAGQKKEADAKTVARQASPSRSDPIAPFLQGWLGSSPARGKFFDEFVRNSGAAADPSSPVGPADTGGSQFMSNFVAVDGNRAVAPVTTQPNPYLQGLDSPARSEAGRNSQSFPSFLTLGAPVHPPSAAAIDPFLAARPVDKKLPLLAPSENEKYFPQLKKF